MIEELSLSDAVSLLRVLQMQFIAECDRNQPRQRGLALLGLADAVESVGVALGQILADDAERERTEPNAVY